MKLLKFKKILKHKNTKVRNNLNIRIYSNLHMDKKLNKYFREILSHLKKLKNSVNFKTVRREFAHDWIKEISIELLYIGRAD